MKHNPVTFMTNLSLCHYGNLTWVNGYVRLDMSNFSGHGSFLEVIEFE